MQDKGISLNTQFCRILHCYSILFGIMQMLLIISQQHFYAIQPVQHIILYLCLAFLRLSRSSYIRNIHNHIPTLL